MDPRQQDAWNLIVVITMLTLILLVYLVVKPSQAQAHPHLILTCEKYVKHHQAELLQEGVLPNGLYSEAYDTNQDKEVDVEAISVVESTEVVEGQLVYHHEPYPLFYVVDLNFDRWPELVVQDVVRDGNCENLRTLVDGRVSATGTQLMRWFLEQLNGPELPPYKEGV